MEKIIQLRLNTDENAIISIMFILFICETLPTTADSIKNGNTVDFV
jgi:hypothetical protein